jgi:hypothetical protein
MTSGKPDRKAKPAAPAPPIAATFRLLFDNHPVPMWVYDLESLAFLEVNEAAVGD